MKAHIGVTDFCCDLGLFDTATVFVNEQTDNVFYRDFLLTTKNRVDSFFASAHVAESFNITQSQRTVLHTDLLQLIAGLEYCLFPRRGIQPTF